MHRTKVVKRRKRAASNRKRKRRTQKGGALAKRRVRTVDKIAEGLSMFLAGPAPTFGTAFGKLGSQALKGITDNYKYYKKSRRL